jgi:hypothetical protein
MPAMKPKRTLCIVLCIMPPLCAALLWLSLSNAQVLQGRYASSGEVLMGNGKYLQASHFIRFNDEYFYAMSRHGDVIIETSGRVEYGLPSHYRLHVDSGEASGLSPEANNDQLFNLLYSRQKGSTIHLNEIQGCLHAMESDQVYCPEQH